LNWVAEGVGSKINDPDDEADVVPLAAVPLVTLLAAVVPLTDVPLVDAVVAAVLAAVLETTEPVVAGRVATAAPLVPLAVVADALGALVAVELEPPHAARIAAVALAATPPRNPRRDNRTWEDCTPPSAIVLPLVLSLNACLHGHASRPIETSLPMSASSLCTHDSTQDTEKHLHYNYVCVTLNS
jgi:hypothetical protein